MNQPPGFGYKCSLCGSTVQPDQVNEHTDAHRAEPEWTGSIGYLRVDIQPDPPGPVV